MADDGDIIIYSIGGFFIGLWLFFRGFRTYRLKKLIENIPTSKIRSLAMGLAEVVGQAAPVGKKVLKTPFSGIACVYYKMTVEEYRHSGKHSRWVTLSDADSELPFYIKDNTGKVLVDPRGADIDIPRDFQCTSGSSRLPAGVRAYVDSHRSSRFLGGGKLRFREWYIKAGDPLYILGTVGDNPDVEDATGTSNTDDLLVQKGDAGFYYISDSGETGVIDKISDRYLLQVFGGIALSAVCLTVIFLYFGVF